jgi:hypothetical protein
MGAVRNSYMAHKEQASNRGFGRGDGYGGGRGGGSNGYDRGGGRSSSGGGYGRDNNGYGGNSNYDSPAPHSAMSPAATGTPGAEDPYAAYYAAGQDPYAQYGGYEAYCKQYTAWYESQVAAGIADPLAAMYGASGMTDPNAQAAAAPPPPPPGAPPGTAGYNSV